MSSRRTWMWAVLALAVLAWPASAQTVRGGSKSYKADSSNAMPIGGMSAGDSTWRIIKTLSTREMSIDDANRDRDYSTIISTFQADSLTPNQYKVFTVPKLVGQFKSFTLGVSLNSNFFAGADSDSVAMLVYPIGKETQSWNDGLDFYFDANLTDTLMTPWVLARPMALHRNVGAALWYAPTMPTVVLLNRVASTGGSFIRSWAGMIPLYNNWGQPFQYPVLGLKIYNPLQRTITNINIDIWGKVN